MKTSTLLNNFLNAHLECLDHNIQLSHITQTLADSPEFSENFTHWPFMLSADDSPLSPEALARITYLYIDDPALDFGTEYLMDLPNLRELHLESFGSIDLKFLRKLPHLKRLHLKCLEIYDQSPLLSLKQLTYLGLDYDRPYLSPLKLLPELEQVYFQKARFEEVLEFLEVHPECLVNFIDRDYGLEVSAEFSLGIPFRYYTRVKDDELRIFVCPLTEGDNSEELNPAEQQEFLRCAAPLVKRLLAEFGRHDNCSFEFTPKRFSDGYEFRFQFQRLLLPAFRGELLEVPRELEELFAEGIDLNKVESWLLKYGELKAEILRQVPGCPLPTAEDSPFTYDHCAETSFLEVYRKLGHMAQLWRSLPDIETLLHQLEPLEGPDFYRQYNALGKNLNCELLFPLWELDILEKQKELLHCLSGYDLELNFPWQTFEPAIQLQKKIRAMGV